MLVEADLYWQFEMAESLTTATVWELAVKLWHWATSSTGNMAPEL
jgi:hypothetical protein